ncbi:signal peptidase II [Cohnella sp. WQ 127256]|uniref:signal peptidase II n=1 Tax=Cohnella sp. WQ 127256 TaxID=2938790 RepID=UPI0021174A83|nr:signal peptidase II [Cohnella sp. WQ 127256]
MLFYLVAIFVISVDQITKYLIRIHVDIGEFITVWGMRFTHYENSGMAGSHLQGYGRLFGVVALLFVVFVFYYRRTNKLQGILLNCSLGLFVGGAIGNGVDRLLFGQVTDFIIRSGGILNVADHAIELGVLFFLLHMVIGWLKNRKA